MSVILETEQLTVLLAEVGLGSEFTATPLKGGANNRAFRIDTADRSVLLKVYFRHPDDPRDRLGTEFAFSQFAWGRGARYLPEPLACDPDHALGLYQYIVGRSPTVDDITAEAITQALAFYALLNAYKAHPEAQRLPNGSEASFSISDHFLTVQRRVERLQTQLEPSPARAFVEKQLTPTWERISSYIKNNNNLDKLLTEGDRCLSPSDFGFHNALIDEAGRFIFFDFEYAGWDDPAKLVCDFFCQPAVPVPMTFFDDFAQQVTANLSDPAWHLERIKLLLPVYQLKWCCILLNDFLPTSRARRRFALDEAGEAERLRRQLEKAQIALSKI